MSEKQDFPLSFRFDDKGTFTLKQSWIDAERDDTTYVLTCGAGLGSPLIEAWARKGDKAVYAIADIREFTQSLFDALTERLNAP